MSRPQDHHAEGKNIAVTTTSKQASDAALWALHKGGNAADAYLVAALAQTVVEHGLTSVAGGFSMKYFDAATGIISSVLGPLGPAEAESYDFKRGSPETQTGRAMPVPGFLSGVHSAHQRFGTLEWQALFEPAIKHAIEGFKVSPLVVSAARSKAARFENGKALWLPDGKPLRAGDILIQSQLGATLQGVASDGAASFYTGEFAREYVRRSKADNGRITRKDMAGWQALGTIRENQLEGNYRGYQVSSGGLNTYALHLAEALDLKSTGPARSNPESMFRQYRIMEEVLLSSGDYSKATHKRFTSAKHARDRAKFVLESPLRKLSFDQIFNTCFLVVRDKAGNCAWGTHSINTPTAFGAGILVGGVYAAHAMNREHVRGAGGSAPGLSTSIALFKEGRPHLIAGSPGFGFVHGPWQYLTAIVEWGLTPTEAMNQPRFGLPRKDGKAYCERHFDKKVFDMLAKRGIPIAEGQPSAFTGLVGALVADSSGKVQVVQDGRQDGYARAE
ncbi:MAG: gamma-glutamyltransferase [Planctomycetes bacterium]|nr:gamma-glutamyltransferase [Planctomycetota bacterium]